MNTKRIFANTLKGLLAENALGDITVSDITSESGLSRSTFYKHFDDKYDLVGWMLPSDRLYELAESVSTEGYESVLENVLEMIEEWQTVYSNAIKDPYEDLVYSKILEHTSGFYHIAFSADTDDGDMKIESIIRQLAVKQINDFLLSWVLGKVDLTKDEVLQVLMKLWPEEIFD